MKKRKRRLDKKRHKYWLGRGVIDASQKSFWRRKLFEAKENFTFIIDYENCQELSPDTIEALRKYKLRYLVAKVAECEAESWLSEDGLVVFKFWPLKYPGIKMYSGNNPDTI